MLYDLPEDSVRLLFLPPDPLHHRLIDCSLALLSEEVKKKCPDLLTHIDRVLAGKGTEFVGGCGEGMLAASSSKEGPRPWSTRGYHMTPFLRASVPLVATLLVGPFPALFFSRPISSFHTQLGSPEKQLKRSAAQEEKKNDTPRTIRR